MKVIYKGFLVGMILGIFFSLTLFGGDTYKKIVDEQLKSIKKRSESQKRVEQISEETTRLLNEYKQTVKSIDDTKVYNDHLKALIQSQESELASIKKQISEIGQVNRETIPLMHRMILMLEKFVQLDTPFLPDERAHRVRNLSTMMKRADVTTSEKFRRILEAYQIENNYGRTIEAYQGPLKINDKKTITVEFLRVGRIALLYQSLNGTQYGSWDKKGKKWKELSYEYFKSVKNGIKIAHKQSVPDLIKLPIAKAEVLK